MKMSVTFRRDGAFAIVELDNAPVNAIGLAVREGLQAALDRLPGEEGLERVILTGAGRAFAAGGDAREFDAPAVAPHLNDVVAQIEASDVPWIAAMNGVALGGGCELALACRYRIAAPAIQIGLPEVGLGIVPGSGGTQRTPRLIGMKAALDLVPTGKPVKAEKALEIGLIDAIAADPVQAAKDLDSGVLAGAMRVCDLPDPAKDDVAIAAARALASKKQKHQIAPQRAIDLIAASSDRPMSEGLAEERQSFMELRVGDQARALRHMFFSERAAKAPAQLTEIPGATDHVAVVGGGTMGAGIAYALLNAGCHVTLLETNAQGVARAQDNVEKIIAQSLKRGLISEAAAQDRRTRLAVSDDYTTAASATLAIEAAFESLEVKREVFTKLEAALPAEAILASNTSYLDLNDIAQTVADPSRVVGLHFFAPAHIMKLLEIVQGDATSDKALATGFALGKKLKKIPVLSGVCDGFIGNRILARYREAADTVMMDHALPQDIDTAMTDFGYAMGPYEAQDLSGLDIAFANRRRQDATRDPNRRYVPIADKMVEAGKLGRKTGGGWYSYAEGTKAADDEVAALVLAQAQAAGITRTPLSTQEIQERMLLAMINEAADILHEGIAATARDIDLVLVFGYGFPRWRGGLMHYADTLGVAQIVDRLQALAASDPLVWTPSPLLLDCLEKGQTLAEVG
jgi:3-hydroxyacyl-CoA dehydrogenase